MIFFVNVACFIEMSCYLFLAWLVAVNELRRKRIRSVCKSISQTLLPANSTPPKHSHPFIPDAFVLDKFRVIFQANAKTGRTSWQFIMWNNSLSGRNSSLWRQRFRKRSKLIPYASKAWELDFLKKFNIKTMRTFNTLEINKRMQTYFKVLTVRHPFIRLESMYLDKISSKHFYYKLYGKEILKLFRNKTKANEKLFHKGKGVTFEEFLKFVLLKPAIDGHWQQFTLSSFPCAINYG